MKQRFLIIHDYQTGGCGFFHYAYDRQEVEKIYDTVHKCDTIFDGDDVLNHSYTKFLRNAGKGILTYDVDFPDEQFIEDLTTFERKKY